MLKVSNPKSAVYGNRNRLALNYVYLALFSQKRKIRSLTKCQKTRNDAYTGKHENKYLHLKITPKTAFFLAVPLDKAKIEL